MSIVNIIVILAVSDFGLWVIYRFVPMARPIKMILTVVVAAMLCLWLLQTYGIIGSIGSIRVR